MPVSFRRVITTLIATDFLIFSGWGLIAPVFAVFILKSVQGGSAGVAGIAAGVFLIVKSFIQLPLARFIDVTDGERDDFWFLVCGVALASLVPIGYIFASLPWHIYALQVLYAIGMAMYSPAWGGLFTRHMSKGSASQVWSIESASVGLGSGLAGILGGVAADTFGFHALFISVSLFNLAGAGGYFFMKSFLTKKEAAPAIVFPKHQ